MNRIKNRLISGLISFVMVLSLAACGESKSTADQADADVTITDSATSAFAEPEVEVPCPVDVLIYEIENGEVTITGCDSSAYGALVIPSTMEGKPVKKIRDQAFERCEGLTSITIPDGVTSIGFAAFFRCTGLTSITIPGSVTSIGEYAFSRCPGVGSITVKSDNTKYHSSGNCLIETDTKTLIAGCKNSIIPSDGSVTRVCIYAFLGCTGLTSITIPVSVTSIDSYAFSDCDAITDVYYAGTEAQWNAIEIDSDNEPLTNATIHFGES